MPFRIRFTAQTLGASDTGAALVPTALRLPTSVFFCGFAACLSVPKASKGSNAFYFTLVVEYQSLRDYKRCNSQISLLTRSEQNLAPHMEQKCSSP